ncbi:3-methyl-2-oxobutanoate hydroxymethyltransferase [Gracilibacillus marinus]|uniref:3-methyl-2-oxobutanoate hydroxymethyltransferase n=1 Tax=Gracilibacillus marinus TaxID=630535 RepID=A0ABV8VTW7_9BACI
MKTTLQLQKMKQNDEKITMVTAYDYPSAKLTEQAEVDMILVGDSLGMVVLGYESTIEVTVDDMIHHAKAVTRGAKETFVVVDMPFMSYHQSLSSAMRNAQKIIQQTRAQALKVEGASNSILEVVNHLTTAGVPVVGHLGLTPQSVNVLGGYRVQGKDKQTAIKLVEDALKLEKNGAIAVVLECVPEQLAALITEKLSIPTIGIGAGNNCDGQVLVYHDILQYAVDYKPSFVKTYADISSITKQAIQQFTIEVKKKEFPTINHSFPIDVEVMDAVKKELS